MSKASIVYAPIPAMDLFEGKQILIPGFRNAVVITGVETKGSMTLISHENGEYLTRSETAVQTAFFSLGF